MRPPATRHGACVPYNIIYEYAAVVYGYAALPAPGTAWWLAVTAVAGAQGASGRRRVALFLQEFVDMLEVVHGVVDEEAQFGYDAQLEPYALAEFVAYACVLLVDGIEDFACPL